MRLAYIFVFPAVLVLSSCGREEPQQAGAPTGAFIPVHMVTAALADWPATYEATGTVRARTSATIASRVTGYVQQVTVQQGDRVAQGQTLVVLDTRDLDANFQRAGAGVSEVTSAIPEAESAVAAAKANLDLAQVTFKRIEDLAAKKSVSNQEFDEASARLKAAQANYDMARAKRTQLQSRMEQAEQERRAAEIMRGYGRMAAPFAGIVTAKSVNVGDMATPGAPLLTIERQDGYRLEASVDESKVSGVRPGQTVRIALEAASCEASSRVSEVVPMVDAASRSYVVKVDLPSCAGLRSGMFGRAWFPLGARKVIALPAAAVIERGQLQSVFVAERETARTRLVTTGERANGEVEILSGLNAGEKVVAPVPAGLADGARLEAR
jgi:multidrug efflux pump subunit AcrA (membrane-fusion protein)